MGKIDARCDRERRQNKQRMTVKWEKERRHLNSDESSNRKKKRNKTETKQNKKE